MKAIVKVSILAAAIMSVVGCKEDTKVETQPETAKVTQNIAQKDVLELETQEQKAAYAMGVSMASYVKEGLSQQTNMPIKLDEQYVLAGFNDVFKSNSRLSKEELEKTLNWMQEETQKVQQELQKKASENAKIAAEKSKTDGVEYRNKFAKEKDVQKTTSGLLYLVEKEGNGVKAKVGDTLVVHYSGSLTNGQVFDSSYDRKEPLTFPYKQLDGFIKGWGEGLKLMSEGAKYKFVIAPELAYGEQSLPNIPGNSTLVFEVELVKINPVQQEATKAKVETAAKESK